MNHLTSLNTFNENISKTKGIFHKTIEHVDDRMLWVE